MRRRSLLKASGSAVAGVAVAGVVPSNVVAGDSYSPTGFVAVPESADAVVGPEGETAYVAAGNGFATVDLSDPENPEVLARVEGIAEDEDGGPMQNIMDVKVSGDRLLVTGPAQRGPISGLVVYDVSDPAAPTPATEFRRTAYSIHNAVLDGDHAYVHGPMGRSVVAFDVSGTTPEEVFRWSPLEATLPGVEGWAERDGLGTGSSLHDLSVHDGTAYCAYWDAGVWMVDVSDPTDPVYVGHLGDYDLASIADRTGSGQYQRFFEAPGNAHYVTVAPDEPLVAVGSEAWDDPETDGGGPGGIDLWDVSDSGSPERLATIAPETAPDLTRGGTWTTAHNFELRNGRLYSSWYEAGVKIHEVSDPSNPDLLAWWRAPDRASFFTAQAGVPGEFFVASTYYARSERTGLYVFPDRAGEQSNPPEPFASSEKWDPTETSRTASRTAATATETATRSPEDTSSTTTGDDDQGMPGFGIGTAVAGLGLGAYRLFRGSGEE